MYCAFCGREVPDGSKFCPVCGTKLNAFEEKDDEGPICQMIFNFPMTTDNKHNISVVNEWLDEHSISFKSLSLTTTLNCMRTHELIFMRCEINYIKQKTTIPYKYQMGYIYKTLKHKDADFEILDKEFDDWKIQNPEKEIIWTYHAVHICYWDDLFQPYLALFYVYRVKSQN